MEMKKCRMGRMWGYVLQGIGIEEAFANADRDIEKLREKIKKEALEEWDRIS